MHGDRTQDPGSNTVHHPWFSQWYLRAEPLLERELGMARRRQNQEASGRTLIIGAGTGLDVPALGSAVADVVLLEPDPTMRRALAHRFPDYHLVAGRAEAMPLAEASFDTVISSLVLCSVDDVSQVLQEIHRVLAIGGQYLFLEHVAHPRPWPRRIQYGLDPLWRRLGGGCRLTRDLEAAIVRSSLTLEKCEWVRRGMLLPVIRGRARRAAIASTRDC